MAITGKRSPELETDKLTDPAIDAAAIFNRRPFRLEGPAARLGAQKLIEQQPTLHRNIIQAISGEQQGARNAIRLHSGRVIRTFVEQAISTQNFSMASEKENENIQYVIGKNAPVLSDETSQKVEAFLYLHQDVPRQELTDLLLAAYIMSIREAQQSNGNTITFQELPFTLILGLMRLEAAEAVHKQISASNSPVQATLREIAKQAENIKATTGEKIIEYEIQYNTLKSAHDEAIKAVSETKETSNSTAQQLRDLSDEFQTRYEDVEKNSNAIIETIKAKYDTKEIRKHWSERANSAWRAWVTTVGLLAVLLVIVPIYALYKHEAVLSFVRNLLDALTNSGEAKQDPVVIAVSTISRLLVVSIPIALYFWIIRLVIRFNTRSMLLMDDANQRSTILETYYRMIENKIAGPEEKGLVLQALTRPTPGHGSDSVDPPNFVEAIRALKP